MNLMEIVRRLPAPEPWSEGEKIPWDEPGFSRRMLAEHLSQAHDAASRRVETIDAHVGWIDRVVLGGRSSRVLDLGCGPGLYTTRLARLGHRCVGIDFSPGSIEHAIATAGGLDCLYRLGDIRATDYGSGYDLVMLTYGEFNVFRPEDALTILGRSRAALAAGGRLLLEVHTVDAVRRIGQAGSSWRTAQRGLFSDRPHLRFDEAFWDEGRLVATERYYVIDAATTAVTRYAQSIQAYTDDAYHVMLDEAWFRLDSVVASLSGETGDGDFFALLAVAV